MSNRKVCKRFLTALLAVVLLLSASAPAALAAVQAKIIASTSVYNVPSTSGKSIRVPRGLTVTMTSYSGNWARVSYKGHTAYIPLAYLNLVNRLTAYTAKSTPVYRSPSTSSQKMGTLSIATAVYVVGRAGSFFRIQNASGSVTGYVPASYLTSKANITASYNSYKKAQASAAAKQAAARAAAAKSAAKKSSSSNRNSATSRLLSLMKSLCGRPYGSNAPSSFNCSSFVAYVMGNFGISMKGTAAEQASDGRYAKITSISSLRVGDVLCFDQTGNGVCDHTAVYIGDGHFVEASQNAGKVQVNSFSDWYRSHFMWARRPS